MSRRQKRGSVNHPGWLLSLAAVGLTLFVIPFIALLAETPWTDLATLLTSDVVFEALLLSILVSVAASIIATVLGVPIAWTLARSTMPGRRILRALVTLPMVLPPVVAGAALLFAFGRRGLVGEPLYELTGLLLPFSTWGAVAAATFVAMPFLIITVEGALAANDGRDEAAATTLGATPSTVFWRITIPSIAPALRAGTLLAWARALGEFGATITFAGNLGGRTQTLPLAVFVELQSDRDAAIALSLVLVAISLLVLLSMRDRWWRP